jgi:selenoprotein W-related protein
MGPRVEIRFCPACRWHARAGWLAQELFTTFGNALGEVALVSAAPGTFDVLVDGVRIFSRSEARRFPEPRDLKIALRDRCFPDHALGHSEPVRAADAEDDT